MPNKPKTMLTNFFTGSLQKILTRIQVQACTFYFSLNSWVQLLWLTAAMSAHHSSCDQLWDQKITESHDTPAQPFLLTMILWYKNYLFWGLRYFLGVDECKLHFSCSEHSWIYMEWLSRSSYPPSQVLRGFSVTSPTPQKIIPLQTAITLILS